jgi:heptosyltransferase III
VKISNKEIKSILIIQLQPFGDVLLNTAYLSTLQNRFPNAKIDFLVSKPFDSILEENPIISELLTFKQYTGLRYTFERCRIFYMIWRRKYSLVIDQQSGTGSAQIVFFSGAKYRLGPKERKWSWIYNMKANRGSERYSASMRFDLLRPLGIREEQFQLYYHIKKESYTFIQDWLEKENLRNEKLICISPGSPSQKKKWDIKYYAELADRILSSTSYTVIILWAKSEEEDLQKLVSLMNNRPVIAPPTSLNQGAALLTHCSLLICNDGGLNHISVVTKTPSLAFFGPTNPLNWCPHSVFPDHYCLANRLKYRPTDFSFGISVDQAYAKVLNILKIDKQPELYIEADKHDRQYI